MIEVAKIGERFENKGNKSSNNTESLIMKNRDIKSEKNLSHIKIDMVGFSFQGGLICENGWACIFRVLISEMSIIYINFCKVFGKL